MGSIMLFVLRIGADTGLEPNASWRMSESLPASISGNAQKSKIKVYLLYD